MLLSIKQNIQFLLLMLLWVATGAFFGQLTIGVVGASILLLVARGYYTEILMGFWLILMLSDSRMEMLLFAQQLKIVFIVLLIFILVIQRRVLIKDKNPIFTLFLPFFLWSLLLVYDNPRVFLSLQKTISYALLFLVVPIYTRHIIEEDQRGTFQTIVFVITTYLILGFLLKYIDLEAAYLVGRFRGLMGNPNGLGVLSFLFAIMFDTFCRKDPWAFNRQIKLFVWLVILGNIYYCGSRSAMLSVVIFLVFSNLKALRGFLGLIVFSSFIISYQYIMNNLPAVVSALGLTEFFRLDTLDGGSGRIIAWQFTWEQIQDNFFIGKGFTYTEWIFWQNFELLTSLGHLGNAHNSFLTFWLNTGLIGLVLFGIAFILMFYSISKKFYNAIPVMYAVIFSANFESWLTASLNPMTIALLIALTVMLYARTIESAEEPQLNPSYAED